ncbi:MAG: ROK family protein [Planctomycetota bacterium]|nr:ROK family protein [Planctomycetota bacterium]MEC9047015.1 ROK family protein [Planctomycetota bacterium]
MRTVLTADLGGTKCRFALVSEDYGVHAVRRVDTVREREPFLANMLAAIEGVLADGRAAGLEPPAAFGVGAAGVVGVDGESLGDPPNLPLKGFGLRDCLSGATKLPVTLLNDGRASAWGEYLRGHAAGRDPLLCLFFGTGIGIGLIADGKPYRGAANAAGEIGHTVYIPGGRQCPCGARGHYEAYCGGRAITERAAAELGNGQGGPWDVGSVVAAAARAEVAAGAILEEAATAACTMVVNACILLNPSAVVLGGGVLSGWPELRTRIIEAVRAQTDPSIHEGLEFVPSMGGSDAILWGAAAATGALWSR